MNTNLCKTDLSRFFNVHAKQDNKCRVFSELNVDLLLLGSGENEYNRLPEIAYATSELMVVVATPAKIEMVINSVGNRIQIRLVLFCT